ncbi:MAG: thioredoxin [Cryomorphaceae bacterium]|nr:thioredoxin [Cryomorphaceae bacterium]
MTNMRGFRVYQFIFVFTFLSYNICCQRNTNQIDNVTLVELMAEEDIQLLDVRTEKEFKDGAIEGAVNIDFWDPDFERKVLSTLNKRLTTVVYCAAGGRSEMAFKLLSKKGFKILYDLQGGYERYTN